MRRYIINKPRSKRYSALTLVIVFGFTLFASLASAPTQNSEALSGSQFNPGRIIDDSVFYSSSSMSATQIQNFLNSKVPTCDTWGTKPSGRSGYPTRADWGRANGVPPPYKCLKSYTANTSNIAPESGLCKGYSGKSGETAAQIIYKVSQSCGISPKVILVMLQKEQSLVTDDWPWPIQYQKAMGAFCPDTAPCDSGYSGFFKQVYYGAERFKVYAANPDSFNYKARRNNTILWHPNNACGTSNVFIENQATASLYIYTPYRPNQAALNNLYGTGDGCSSYGNRNFWRMFNDWFGTTYGSPYYASYENQSMNPSLQPGQKATVHITYRNSGNWAWYDNETASSGTGKPMRLATMNPVNRKSSFGDASWGSDRNRPTGIFDTVYQTNGAAYTTDRHYVLPGESAKFAFEITVPANMPAGKYREYFGLVNDGGAGVMPTNITPWIDITVQKVHKANYVSQSAHPTLRGGEVKTAYITYKNTGNVSWYDNTGLSKAPSGTKPTRLATTNPINRSSTFGDASWGSGRNRPTGVFNTVYRSDGSAYSTNPHIVKPGESAKFAFTFTAPDNHTPGVTSEYFVPVNDGGSGIITTNTSVWSNVTVMNAPSAKAITSNAPVTVNALTSKAVTYTFKNTGTTTWNQATTYLDVVSGDASKLKSSGWPSNTRVDQLNEATVAPGANGTFTVTYDAPQLGSKLTFSLSPSVSGQDIGLTRTSVVATVPNPVHKATYHNQSPYPYIQQNSSKVVFFGFKNTGNVEWHDFTSAQASGLKPVVLANTEPINRGSRFGALFARPHRPAVDFAAVYESDGTTLAANQHVAQPGQIVRFSFTLTAPQNISTGRHREWFQPILEGGSPWDMQQKVWLDIVVTGANYSASFAGQSGFPTIAKNTSAQSFFKFKNTGNAPWYDATSRPAGLRYVVLAATDPINRISKFNATFAGHNRPTVNFASVYESDGVTLATNQHIVQPGQIGRFNFTFTAPENIAAGTYREVFQPIVEGGSPWSMGQIAWLYVTVPN